MFEIMATKQENLDGDQWKAKMHTDESFPGSDIILTNQIEIKCFDCYIKM